MANSVPQYREWRPAPELAGLVACTWAGRLADDGTPFTERVIPDACVDLIWDGRRLFVAGPDTGPVPIVRTPGAVFAGVRFRPGLASMVLGVPASALLDQRVDATDVFAGAGGRRSGAGIDITAVVDGLEVAGSLREAASALEQFVIARLPAAAPADRVVVALVEALRGPLPPGSPMSDLADRLGVSERQLHRRSTAAVGYGPKTLDRVLRFRRFLHLVESPVGTPGGIAGLAAAAGYADQSHLTRECVRLAGTTPARLPAVRSVQDAGGAPPVSLGA